jgi:hypothetical protein
MTAPVVQPPLPRSYNRQPLGLPAGSIRAILALTVLGLIWALMLLPESKEMTIPLYLFCLMFLILGHFFAAHGYSIAGPTSGTASPLYLPRGSIRLIMILGFVGVLVVRYRRNPDWQELLGLLKLRESVIDQPYLPIILVGAFFLGIFFAKVFGRILSGQYGPPPWFQDVQAWLALLATLGLIVQYVIELGINPGRAPENRIRLQEWEVPLASIICFYFGARS